MKKVILLSMCIVSIMCTVVFVSCEHEEDDFIATKDVVLNKFLQSSIAEDFMISFEVNSSNLNTVNMKKLPQGNDSEVLYIPLIKEGKEVGRLCVFVKNKGSFFQVLYEDWTGMENNTGVIKIFNANKHYIASWGVQKESETKYSYKIIDVAQNEDAGFNGIKTRTEIDFPKPGDSGCLEKCYKAAKDACDADPDCKFLCDMLDVFACSATVSIAAACAIYCI